MFQCLSHVKLTINSQTNTAVVLFQCHVTRNKTLTQVFYLLLQRKLGCPKKNLHCTKLHNTLHSTHLWCAAYVLLDKSRVRIILDVMAVNEVLQVIESVVIITRLKLQHTHLKYVDLRRQTNSTVLII